MLTPRKIARYGWQPDLPDNRDFAYALKQRQQLPTKIDLTKQCPPVYNQSNLGSCTANAIGAAFEFGQMKQNLPTVFMPSRLFIYYNERVIEKSVATDSGAQIRDGIKTVHKQGVCPETIWPYDINKFANKPLASAYKNALANQLLNYSRLPRDINHFKACLAEGYPFVFGFTVYDAFESDTVAATGKLNMPKKNESVIGGHAVMAVGYNDATQRFIIRNSWGNGWGKKGYFTMPYDYLLSENLSDDFWTMRLVEVSTAAKTKKKK